MAKTEKPRRAQCSWAGTGQLTLVEHALCPLDPKASLVENLVFDAGYFFLDKNRHWRKAKPRMYCPRGLSANDELYLWGLLAISLAQIETHRELHATPHYCLRQMGLIDSQTRRGGEQYRQFGEALERLSLVRYRNDLFYDPIRAEHRKVSFGFLSYSLPLHSDSSRAWRIAWDPIFFEFARATSGSFRFDLEVYRQLDPASRRLFMLLCKLFHRRTTTPRFDLRHLAVEILGFAPSVSARNLKTKVERCVNKLAAWNIVDLPGSRELFQKCRPGDYSLALSRGSYFLSDRAARFPVVDSPMMEQLQALGFEAAAARQLLKRYPSRLLREWIDITLAAKERFGQTFFKKNAAAYLQDNLRHAAQGQRTPPDWWQGIRKEEASRRVRGLRKPDLPLRNAALIKAGQELGPGGVESVLAHFQAAGQSVEIAFVNASKFTEAFARMQSPAGARLPLKSN